MQFHPTITFEQYRDSCKAVAAAKAHAGGQRSWKGYVGLATVSLALGLGVQIPPTRVPAYTVLVLLTLCWIFFKPLARRSGERCLKMIFAEEQDALNDQFMSVDASGISCASCRSKATSYHPWGAFIRRINMHDAYIFLPSPNSFIRVPKNMLSSAEIELLRQWSSKVPTANGR